MSTNTKTREYCPCCHQPLAKPRLERLTPKLCDALRRISKNCREGAVFVKVPAYEFQGLHPRLRHWGFLEEQTYERKDGSEARRPGSWRITAKGLRFLQGDLSVPGVLRLEEDQVVELMNPKVDLAEAEGGMALAPGSKIRKQIEDQEDEEADDEGESMYLREQDALERSYKYDEE